MAYQIQKLTSGYENRGNTLARLGAIYSILKSSATGWYGSCITEERGEVGLGWWLLTPLPLWLLREVDGVRIM